MLDNLGFHTDRDLHAELATLDQRIISLSAQTGHGSSWTDIPNAWAELDNTRFRVRVLRREAAMEDQRLHRLDAAVRIVGDPVLGFIAYVVFGPAALPIAPLYEIRLIDPNGIYTVPESIRTNLPASRVDAAVKAARSSEVIAQRAAVWGDNPNDYRVQITAF